MANFNSLPIPVHAEILNYVATPPEIPLNAFTTHLPKRYLKNLFYENVKNYQSLNHAWRYLVQAQLWNNIFMTPFEVSQLRELLMANPALGTHIRVLDLRSSVGANPTIPPAPPNILFDGLAGDTKGGLLIFQIWSELIEIINLYLQSGKLQELSFVTGFSQNEPRIDIPRIVQFPKRNCIPVVSSSQLRSFKLGGRFAGDLLGGFCIGKMVECISAGLEELHIDVSTLEIGDRRTRRATYVGITKLTTGLLHLSPNPTTFFLQYWNYKPQLLYESKLYSYTHLDNNEDLLSRALRILSKKLVNFTYHAGRISQELFLSSSTTMESPEWPHLKCYKILFSKVASDGTWRFDFKGSDAHGNSPLHLPPSDGMNATDPDYFDSFGDGYYGFERTVPNRVLADAIFETASRAMVPNMPMIEYWDVKLDSSMDILLKLEYDKKRKRIVRTGRGFKHKKETMAIWSDWFGREVLEDMNEDEHTNEEKCSDEEDYSDEED